MRKLIIGYSLLCIMFLPSCGGGGGGGESDPVRVFFDSGTGFNISVSVVALAVDGSGDIYVGGDFSDYNGTTRNFIARLNSDGSLDAGFNPGTGFNSSVITIAPLTDGSGDIYVGGTFGNYGGVPREGIARLNSDGSLDTGFNPGTGFNSNARVITIAPSTDGSGDIYVGGGFTTYGGISRNSIVRLNNDGSLDAGFNPGTGFSGGVATVHTILVTSDSSGDIYAGGIFNDYRGNTRAGLARINSDGSDDAGFNQGTGFAPALAGVTSLAFAADNSGDIYIGGGFTSYNGMTGRNRIARLNNDGTLDTAFSTGSGFDFVVLSIAVATNGSGDIYAGGQFTLYRGNVRNRIARINSDGSNDGAFDSGAGYNDAGGGNLFVGSVAVANDGSGDIYVGGNFTTYQSVAAGRISRVDLTGASY